MASVFPFYGKILATKFLTMEMLLAAAY